MLHYAALGDEHARLSEEEFSAIYSADYPLPELDGLVL